MAARSPPRGETNALPSRPLEFPFRTTLAVLGNTAMPYSNPAPVPCMGVSDRPPLLVYQWDHMPWYSSGNVGKEDEALSQLRRISHHVSRPIEIGQASLACPVLLRILLYVLVNLLPIPASTRSPEPSSIMVSGSGTPLGYPSFPVSLAKTLSQEGLFAGRDSR